MRSTDRALGRRRGSGMAVSLRNPGPLATLCAIVTDVPSSIDVDNLDPIRRLALEGMSAAVLDVYRLVRGSRLHVGRGVICNHRLIIKGPGQVSIGDRANLFAFGEGRRTRLITRRPGAEIRIGENARLNGADLQADTLIEIGPDCIVGQAHLVDTDMHSLALDRRTN